MTIKIHFPEPLHITLDSRTFEAGLRRAKAVLKREGDRLRGEMIDRCKLPPITVADKIRRNEPCPCGSGRKFKACCGDVQ